MADATNEPKMVSASLTVKLQYDPRSSEEERATKLVAAMMGVLGQAIEGMNVPACSVSCTMAHVLLASMGRNGHENCACSTAMNYLKSTGAEIEVIEPEGTSADQRKAMH